MTGSMMELSLVPARRLKPRSLRSPANPLFALVSWLMVALLGLLKTEAKDMKRKFSIHVKDFVIYQLFLLLVDELRGAQF